MQPPHFDPLNIHPFWDTFPKLGKMFTVSSCPKHCQKHKEVICIHVTSMDSLGIHQLETVCFEVLYRQYPLWHHFNSGYLKYITKVLTYLSIFSDHDISTVSIFNTQYKCSHTVTSTRSGEIIYGLITSENKSLKKMIQIVCIKHFRIAIVCMGGGWRFNLVYYVWL